VTGNRAYRTISLGSSKEQASSGNLIIKTLRSGQHMASKSSRRMAIMSQKDHSQMKTTTPNQLDGSPLPLARTVQTKAPMAGRVRLPKEAYM
jgi:hypothetical protein